MSFSTTRAIITPSSCKNGLLDPVPDQAALHPVLLSASQSDRAAVGPHAQKCHAQQMLCNLRSIRRCGTQFSASNCSTELGGPLRFGKKNWSAISRMVGANGTRRA